MMVSTMVDIGGGARLLERESAGRPLGKSWSGTTSSSEMKCTAVSYCTVWLALVRLS